MQKESTWELRKKEFDAREREEYCRHLLDDDAIDSEINREKIKFALEKAYEVRHHEIAHMWTRSAHFWLFITAMGFVYYEALKYLSENDSDNFIISNPLFAYLCVSFINCIACTVSYVWFEVIRSSRNWIKSWETHIEMLEFDVTGHLYKLAYEDTSKVILSGPKLNQVLALMCIMVWIVIQIISTYVYCLYNQDDLWIFLVGILCYLAILICTVVLIRAFCKSSTANNLN